MKALILLLGALALSACDSLPRDPDRTLEKIQQSDIIRVGLVAPASADLGKTKTLLVALERKTGARAQMIYGAAEPLLKSLDEGDIDIVIGPFAKETPWASEVAFGPPLASHGSDDDPVEIKAAMRNGENRWIMLVESASRSVSPEAKRS